MTPPFPIPAKMSHVLITGFFGKALTIDDTIFNSFVIITLGSFGIDGITKIFKKPGSEE